MKRLFTLKMFRMLSEMPLQGKFLLILVLTSALSLLFACSALLFNDLFQIRESLVEKLADQAGLIGDNSSAALVFKDEDTAQEILSGFAHQSNIQQAILFTSNGQILQISSIHLNKRFTACHGSQ